MSKSNENETGPWYNLLDLATGQVVGRINAAGTVESPDPAVQERVRAAFARQVLVSDGEVVEDLGVCFAGIETLPPGTDRHVATVLRNLAALTGLLPIDTSTDHQNRA